MASEPTVPPLALKCPVCNAGFRGVEICPRCGTNLQDLMRLAARAWALRQQSRKLLAAGDIAAGVQCFAAAWQTQRTPVGQPGPSSSGR